MRTLIPSILGLVACLSTRTAAFDCYDKEKEGRDGICPTFVRERKCIRGMDPLPRSNGTDFYFGVIQSMSTSDASWVSPQHIGMLCGIRDAQRQIAPEINFQWIYADDRGNQNGGFEAGLCLVDAQVPLTFGPYYSGASFGAATVAKNSVSGFPTFSRIVPNDGFQGKGLVHLCRRFGWEHVATIHARGDVYSEGVVESFASEAREHGLKILAGESFDRAESSDESISALLQRIKGTGVRVILAVFYPEDAERLLLLAKEHGMIGDGWVWLAGESWINYASEMQDGVGVGSLGLIPDVDLESDRYKNLSSCVSEHFDDLEGMFGNYSWLTSTPSEFAPYSYDAAFALVMAVKELADKGMDMYNATLMIKTLRGVSFYGATGQVRIDPDTGERVGVSYKIRNAQPNQVVTIGKLDTQTQKVEEGEEFTSAVFDADGATQVPLDLKVSCSIRNPTQQDDEAEGEYELVMADRCSGGLREVRYEKLGDFAEKYCPDLEGFNARCDYPDAAQAGPLVAFILLLLCLLIKVGLLLYMVLHWSHAYLKRGQRSFLFLCLVGCMLIDLPFYVTFGQPPSHFSCTVLPLLVSMGTSLAFGCLGLKMWRINMIVLASNFKRLRITDSMLFKRLAALVLFVLGLNVALILHTPPHPEAVSVVESNFVLTLQRRCATGSNDVVGNLLLFFIAMIMIGSCYFSFRLRNVKSDISESHWIFLATYHSTMCALVAIAAALGLDLDMSAEYTILTISATVGSTGIACLLLVPKYSKIYFNVKVASISMGSSAQPKEVGATTVIERTTVGSSSASAVMRPAP